MQQSRTAATKATFSSPYTFCAHPRGTKGVQVDVCLKGRPMWKGPGSPHWVLGWVRRSVRQEPWARAPQRAVGARLSRSSAPGWLHVSREASASHVLIFIISVSGLYSGQGSKWQRKGKCLASPPRSSAWAQHLLILLSSPPPLWVLFPLPYGRKLVVDLRNTLLQFSPSGFLPCWTMRWLLVWSVGETFSISMILKTQPSSWSKLTGTAQHLGPNPTLWLTGQVWPWVSFLASLSPFSHL